MDANSLSNVIVLVVGGFSVLCFAGMFGAFAAKLTLGGRKGYKTGNANANPGNARRERNW